jgi:hypothetical protein
MRIEKDGFVLHLEGTWLEISGRYGVLEHGDVAVKPEDIPEGYAEKRLDEFISRHSVREMTGDTCIKRVAYDPEAKRYIQLQAIRPDGAEYFTLQKFDDELVYMGEELTGCKYKPEVVDWLRATYSIERCLTACVFRSGLGDCTNGGISSARRELYIISDNGGPFEPEDIRECVYMEYREVCGEKYVDAKPLYCPRRWYMAGGNFLYTSDSRYKDITGISYPVSIHDRYEGR